MYGESVRGRRPSACVKAQPKRWTMPEIKKLAAEAGNFIVEPISEVIEGVHCRYLLTDMARSFQEPVKRPQDIFISIRVRQLAARFENGEDFWSGEPLRGDDADDWLQLQFEMREANRDHLIAQEAA